MIRETSLEIDATHRQAQAEIESRQVRRNRVRYIDHLLNELEKLNLQDAAAMPPRLHDEVHSFLAEHHHSVGRPSPRSMTIGECMDALYDVQDALMVGGADEDDA